MKMSKLRSLENCFNFLIIDKALQPPSTLKQIKLKTICRLQFLMQNNSTLWEHKKKNKRDEQQSRCLDIFLIVPWFSISVMLLNPLMFSNFSFGKKIFFCKEKNNKPNQTTKPPTFSSFYLFLKDFIWAQVSLYVVGASKSVNFPHIYTSLHNFKMKLCLTLTWLPQDLTANQQSFCYIRESTLFQPSSRQLLSLQLA